MKLPSCKARSEAALKRPKPKIWYQILVTFTATLTVMSVGLHYAWTSPTLPKLFAADSHIPISGGEGSWLAIATLMSAIFGALVASYLCDRIGRRYSILVTIPFYVASWVSIALAPNFYVLMFGRIIAGVSDGIAYTVVPIYIAEIAHCDVRGFLASCLTVVLIVGQLLMNAIAPFVSIQMAALLAALVPVLQLVLCPFIPESPYYLLMKEDYAAAKTSLQNLRRVADVDIELNELRNAVKRQMAESGQFKDLLVNKSNRKALLITMGLRTTQQLSGTSAFAFYTQHIFAMAGDTISPAISTIIYTGLQLVLCFFSSLLLDKLGRRFLFTISCIGSSLTLVAGGVYFYLQTETSVDVTRLYWLPIATMLLYIFVFSIGMCTIPMTMLSELFPTNIKAKALAFMDIYFSIIVCVITKLFQYVADNFGMHVPFFIFAICCVGGVVFALLCVPETKGKTLEEIQMWLRNEQPDVSAYKKHTEAHSTTDTVPYIN